MIQKVFPVVALITFTAMLGGGIIAPLLPRYATGMGATPLMLGVIVASYSVSKAVLMPFIGRYSDRLGRSGSSSPVCASSWSPRWATSGSPRSGT